MRHILLIGLLAAFAMAQGVVCVIDNLPLISTGRSRNFDGVLLYEYKCAKGHVYWVRP